MKYVYTLGTDRHKRPADITFLFEYICNTTTLNYVHGLHHLSLRHYSMMYTLTYICMQFNYSKLCAWLASSILHVPLQNEKYTVTIVRILKTRSVEVLMRYRRFLTMLSCSCTHLL